MIKDSTPYRILVIEDNPGDFVLVEDFLFEQIESPVIQRAHTYGEAASILCNEDCNKEPRFDVILLDLSLPDNTGEPLIKDILAFCYQSPLIVLTGYADAAFGIKSLSWGVSDYILKEDLTSVSLYKSIVYNIERKKSTSALEESEKRYIDLFDLSPLPMWVVDLNTLEFLDVNKATVANYGYSREEFLRMTLKDIRPPQELPKLYEGLKLGRQNPDAPSQRVMVHQMKNGDIRNVDLQISPILYKNRKVSIVIATDITERIKYIQAIEEQNEKLKEISWMQSHIIRAPLSRIMGLVSLMKDPNATECDKQLMLDFLTQSADELDQVIRNIIEKSKRADFRLPGE